MLGIRNRKYISLPGELLEGNLNLTFLENYSTINLPPMNVFWLDTNDRVAEYIFCLILF